MTDQPDDLYPSDLDDRDPGDWASIEAREADHDTEPSDDHCAFLAQDTRPELGSCPTIATTVRDMNGVPFAACPNHAEAGGILHQNARRRLVLELVAVGNVDSERVRVTDDGERVSFARFCAGCGCALFTGNTSGQCSACATDYFDVVFPPSPDWPAQATATPPQHPFKSDRTSYEAPGMAAWRAENLR